MEADQKGHLPSLKGHGERCPIPTADHLQRRGPRQRRQQQAQGSSRWSQAAQQPWVHHRWPGQLCALGSRDLPSVTDKFFAGLDSVQALICSSCNDSEPPCTSLCHHGLGNRAAAHPAVIVCSHPVQHVTRSLPTLFLVWVGELFTVKKKIKS